MLRHITFIAFVWTTNGSLALDIGITLVAALVASYFDKEHPKGGGGITGGETHSGAFRNSVRTL